VLEGNIRIELDSRIYITERAVALPGGVVEMDEVGNHRNPNGLGFASLA
jgi:hypothetical protein